MGGMVRCPQCGAVLHSTYRHDCQECNCENHTMVDGGEDYMRVGGAMIDDIVIVPHVHLAGNLGGDAS